MLAIELAEYLHAQKLLKFDKNGASGNTFINIIPASPSEAFGIFQTGGMQSEVKLGYDRPTLQIFYRGDKNPIATAEKVQEIYDTLHGFSHQSFIEGGSYILSCLGLQSGPVHVGTDENGRHQYSLNFIIEVQNLSRRNH
ncbi:minor capsid protein [Lysinibacillus irui]|uniref:Minor capsid protein n=1 Tax=Lysinibacillus irui TaxID=2998077 RepID=A0ABU5NJD1_9BACI|nr:minor capsid protein [Lysinibacillus irui]MEA0553760.1 minor capsid protein [Lysinibacillus irui]MEA0976144.1 minor capsid protein [Lysinibacillus irui]MEA1042298.1 minor capsid protein [Lysinibacillus irui]